MKRLYALMISACILLPSTGTDGRDGLTGGRGLDGDVWWTVGEDGAKEEGTEWKEARSSLERGEDARSSEERGEDLKEARSSLEREDTRSSQERGEDLKEARSSLERGKEWKEAWSNLEKDWNEARSRGERGTEWKEDVEREKRGVVVEGAVQGKKCDDTCGGYEKVMPEIYPPALGRKKDEEDPRTKLQHINTVVESILRAADPQLHRDVGHAKRKFDVAALVGEEDEKFATVMKRISKCVKEILDNAPQDYCKPLPAHLYSFFAWLKNGPEGGCWCKPVPDICSYHQAVRKKLLSSPPPKYRPTPARLNQTKKEARAKKIPFSTPKTKSDSSQKATNLTRPTKIICEDYQDDENIRPSVSQNTPRKRLRFLRSVGDFFNTSDNKYIINGFGQNIPIYPQKLQINDDYFLGNSEFDYSGDKDYIKRAKRKKERILKNKSKRKTVKQKMECGDDEDYDYEEQDEEEEEDQLKEVKVREMKESKKDEDYDSATDLSKSSENRQEVEQVLEDEVQDEEEVTQVGTTGRLGTTRGKLRTTVERGTTLVGVTSEGSEPTEVTEAEGTVQSVFETTPEDSDQHHESDVLPTEESADRELEELPPSSSTSLPMEAGRTTSRVPRRRPSRTSSTAKHRKACSTRTTPCSTRTTPCSTMTTPSSTRTTPCSTTTSRSSRKHTTRRHTTTTHTTLKPPTIKHPSKKPHTTCKLTCVTTCKELKHSTTKPHTTFKSHKTTKKHKTTPKTKCTSKHTSKPTSCPTTPEEETCTEEEEPSTPCLSTTTKKRRKCITIKRFKITSRPKQKTSRATPLATRSENETFAYETSSMKEDINESLKFPKLANQIDSSTFLNYDDIYSDLSADDFQFHKPNKAPLKKYDISNEITSLLEPFEVYQVANSLDAGETSSSGGGRGPELPARPTSAPGEAGGGAKDPRLLTEPAPSKLSDQPVRDNQSYFRLCTPVKHITDKTMDDIIFIN